ELDVCVEPAHPECCREVGILALRQGQEVALSRVWLFTELEVGGRPAGVAVLVAHDHEVGLAPNVEIPKRITVARPSMDKGVDTLGLTILWRQAVQLVEADATSEVLLGLEVDVISKDED